MIAYVIQTANGVLIPLTKAVVQLKLSHFSLLAIIEVIKARKKQNIK